MYLFVSVGVDTEFYIVDIDNSLIRKSSCKNCDVGVIVRMVKLILSTYPNLDSIRVDDGAGFAVADALEKQDWVKIPVDIFKVRKL